MKFKIGAKKILMLVYLYAMLTFTMCGATISSCIEQGEVLESDEASVIQEKDSVMPCKSH